MVTNLKAISNPLTIVAIFAGLAEVVGTVMLGLVDVSIQPIFVWFVMLFPVLIVCLFFATLNWNSKVLYAPSDFRDDDKFLDMMRVGKVQVHLQSVKEGLSEIAAAPAQALGQSPATPQVPASEAGEPANQEEERIARADPSQGERAAALSRLQQELNQAEQELTFIFPVHQETQRKVNRTLLYTLIKKHVKNRRTVSVKELAEATGVNRGEVETVLMRMELEGLVRALPDGRYEAKG